MNDMTPNAIEHEPVHNLPMVTPMTMIERALEKGHSVDVLEKLMELAERNENKIARRAFDAAIASAKAEFKPIHKSGKVSHGAGKTAFEHETMADIEKAVQGALSRYGIHYRFRTEQSDRVTVTCVIAHKDGHSEENSLSGAPDSSGAKNSIQAIGSVVTYLERYTLKAALGLAASNDDDGQAAEQRVGNENISADQWQELTDLIEKAGIPESVVLTSEKISALDFLPARRFQTVKGKLSVKIKENGGN